MFLFNFLILVSCYLFDKKKKKRKEKPKNKVQHGASSFDTDFNSDTYIQFGLNLENIVFGESTKYTYS